MIKTITLSIFLVLFINGLSISQSREDVRSGEGKDDTGNTTVKEQLAPNTNQEQKSNSNNSTTKQNRIEVKSEPPKLEKNEKHQVNTNTQTTRNRTNTVNNNTDKTKTKTDPVIKDNKGNSNSSTVVNIKSDDRKNSGRENESTSQSGIVTIKPDDNNNNAGPVDENTPQSGVVSIKEEEGNSSAGPVDENTPQSGVVTTNDPVIIYTNEESTITHSNPIPYVETNNSNSSVNNTTIINSNRQSNYGNYYYRDRQRGTIPEKYTEPDASFMLGALKTTTKYPERFNIGTNPVQSGFQFGSRYNIHKIEDISMKGVANLGLNLIGSFNLGFASATDRMIYNDAGMDYDYTTNHYTFIGDLFSLSGNAEYKANVFEERGIVLGMSVTFFNLGGAATYMSGGRYDEGLFGVVNILPLYLQPYAKLKFMGGTLGVGLQLNPYNFLEYRFGPDNFWGEGESGFHTNSSKISRYAIEAYFKF